MPISGKDNPQVKRWRLLTADRRARRETGLFACEGARLCADAAKSGVEVVLLLYTEKAAATYVAQMEILLKAARRAEVITPAVAQHMSDTDAPQGIFCICAMPQCTKDAATLDEKGRYLALEDVQDPANLGAVIRTAEALGLRGLLLSDGCCDVYNPKVLRASMGGVFRLPLFAAGKMKTLLPRLRERGMRAFACVPDAAAVPVCDAPLTDGCICLIGNEGNGLRAETIAASDAAVTIPMAGRAESLNAAMAAGIVMWELVRR